MLRYLFGRRSASCLTVSVPTAVESSASGAPLSMVGPRKKVPPETPEEVTKKLKEQRDYWDNQVGFSAASKHDPELSSIKVQSLECCVRPAMELRL